MARAAPQMRMDEAMMHPKPHMSIPVGASPSPSHVTCTTGLGLHFPEELTPLPKSAASEPEPERREAVFAQPCKVNPWQAAWERGPLGDPGPLGDLGDQSLRGCSGHST